MLPPTGELCLPHGGARFLILEGGTMPDQHITCLRVQAALSALRANRAAGDERMADINEHRLNELLESLLWVDA